MGLMQLIAYGANDYYLGSKALKIFNRKKMKVFITISNNITTLLLLFLERYKYKINNIDN